MKRTTTRSLLLRQRRGGKVMAVRMPIPKNQQAACHITCGNLTAACRRSCIRRRGCAVA